MAVDKPVLNKYLRFLHIAVSLKYVANVLSVSSIDRVIGAQWVFSKCKLIGVYMFLVNGTAARWVWFVEQNNAFTDKKHDSRPWFFTLHSQIRCP